MARDWSELEVTAIVQDYLAMLADDLDGRQFSKAEHRRALMGRLDGRSEGAVEFKHANISAWMIENGLPYVEGYKPRFNYQAMVGVVASRALADSAALRSAIERETLRMPVGFDRELVNVPAPARVTGDPSAAHRAHRTSGLPDYVALQEANTLLGTKGEEAVLERERRSLYDAGRKDLSAKVEWVAQTRGPAAGYDILSFQPSGAQRHVEVKTTNFGIYTPFYLSAAELDRSRQLHETYVLCRLFDFSRHARIFELTPPLEKHCKIQATQYRATIGA